MTWALSTAEVREAYILAKDTTNADRDNGEDFDAWLAAHDAEVRAQAEAVVSMSAYDDGHTAGEIAGRASVVTEEPDWEYRAVACEPDTGDVYNSTGRPAPSEQWARSDAALEELLQSDPDLPQLVLKVQRRRKAGPWGLVEQGDDT